MIRQIITVGIVILLTVGLGACKSDKADQAAASNSKTENILPVTEGELQTARTTEQPVSDNEAVISDVAAWDHPVKRILAGPPFELYQVVLTNDSTYPKFYVRYPDADAVSESKDLPDQLLRIAKENGYWDYELVNEQDAVTIQVMVDKSAKKLADVRVNGEPYAGAYAADTGVSADGSDASGTDRLPIDNSGSDEQENGTVSAIRLPEKYAKFVEDNGIGGGYEPVFFETGVLNADGTEEAVVAFGEDDYIYEAYILGERNGEVTQFGDSFAEGYGYSVVSIELVHAQDRPEPVPLLEITNDVSMSGFHLFRFDGKEPVSWVYSASPTGSGYDHLTDGNHDGKYDSYVQERHSYEVLNYYVARKFELRDGDFVQTQTMVDLGDYPQTAKEAAAQYAALYSLDDGLSSEIKERLAELGPALKDTDRDTFEKLWEPFGADGSYGISDTLRYESNFIEQTNKKTNETTVILTESLDNGKDNKLAFRLAQQDGRWVIVGFNAISKIH